MAGAVLILGAEPRVAVTIARSLHRHGVSVAVAALSPQEPRVRSRAIRSFDRVPGGSPGEMAAALFRIIDRQDFDLLIPSTDSALSLVAAHHDDLRARLALGCPPADVVGRVLDKAATLDAARRCGIPVPAAYEISSLEDLERLESRLAFPVVAKPRSKTPGEASSFKVRYFHSAAGLGQAFETDPDFGRRNLLQGYCPGAGVGVAMLVAAGEPLAVFQHRRLREFPATGGVGVLTVSERPDPDLVAHATRLLRALGWHGVAMVEFRHDPSIGQTTLMEVNGRYWGSLSTAIHAGMDFPYYEWQLVRGERPSPPAVYPAGVRVRWLTGDLLRLHSLVAGPPVEGFPRPSRWKEIGAFIADFRPSVRSASWVASDPVPAAAEVGRAVVGLARADLKRIARRMVPRTAIRLLGVYRMLGRQEGSTYLRLRAARSVGARRDQGWRRAAGARSVLFVCHGNIIRSPMAAAMLARALQASGRAITVRSAGLHVVPGAAADERARAAARDFGICLDGCRAQPLTPALVGQSDLIFVMDYLNEARLITRYPGARGKVFLLGACADGGGPPARGPEIADPYHGDIADVRRCFAAIEPCVRALADVLRGPAW